MPTALTRDAQTLDESGFSAFVMSEFHIPAVEGIVAREEAVASKLIGARPCSGQHADAFVRWTHGPRAGTYEYRDDVLAGKPCPDCGAAV